MIERLFNTNLKVLKYVPQTSSWGSSAQYTESGSYKCSIQPITARDSSDGSKLFNEAEKKVYTQFISNLNSKDRLLIDDVTYEITAVLNEAGRDNHLKILVKVAT